MKRISRTEKSSGFTLLEMMIALSIFALLMLYVTQFMKMEIGTFNQATAESALEAKGRSAMMHILDEVRLNKYTYYQSGAGGAGDPGIYGTAPTSQVSRCLVDLEPSSTSPQADIYYDQSEEAQGDGKLYYQPQAGGSTETGKYLIADRISSLTVTPLQEDNGLTLVEIDIIVGGKTSGGVQPYELISWIRLN